MGCSPVHRDGYPTIVHEQNQRRNGIGWPRPGTDWFGVHNEGRVHAFVLVRVWVTPIPGQFLCKATNVHGNGTMCAEFVLFGVSQFSASHVFGTT